MSHSYSRNLGRQFSPAAFTLYTWHSPSHLCSGKNCILKNISINWAKRTIFISCFLFLFLLVFLDFAWFEFLCKTLTSSDYSSPFSWRLLRAPALGRAQSLRVMWLVVMVQSPNLGPHSFLWGTRGRAHSQPSVSLCVCLWNRMRALLRFRLLTVVCGETELCCKIRSVCSFLPSGGPKWEMGWVPACSPLGAFSPALLSPRFSP